ncbi:MAG: sulfurtransferase, partial [Desulfovibrionales bacterium]|nr:sulfurtransferase [Desulfovibrionales bacterium]
MSYLVESSWLASRLDDKKLRIIDTRFSLQDPKAGEALYHVGHIPGAVYADLEKDLSAQIVTGQTGRHPLPDYLQLVERLQSWGIDKQTEVVIYDDGSHAMAARLWWLLAVWLRHSGVRILHGGIKAWQAQDGELVGEIKTFPGTRYQPDKNDSAVVSTEDMLAALDDRGCLIDARELMRFRGESEPIDPVAGHIPGAVCLPYQDNLDDKGYFLSRDKLQERFLSTAGQETICYCGSGVTACHNIFAMALAGLPLPKLYAGSWSEWIL